MKTTKQTLLHRLFETITRFQDLDVAHRELVACLSEWTGADAGLLLRLNRAGESHAPLCCHARDAETAIDFQDRFQSHFFSNAQSAGILGASKSVLLMSTFLGEKAWRTSPLKKAIFQPLRATDAVVLLLRERSRETGLLACFAIRRRSPQLKDNLRTLESAVPQLCAGLENLTAWSDRWKRAQAIETLLGYTNDLLVCVTHAEQHTPRVIAATRAAQHALGLSAETAAPSERMNEFLEQALAVKKTVTTGPRWLSPGGQLYRITRETPGQGHGSGLSLFRLQAVTESQPEPSPADDLRAANLLGLSSRESGVFAHMARGLGNREIAEALGISIDTVRAHLRNVFAKLNVSSRVEAINAVRRGLESSETFSEAAKSPIDTPAALNNDTSLSSNRVPGLNRKTEPTPHANGITAQAT